MTSGNDDRNDFDLDALKSAVNRATPAADPLRRTENLRLAQENFDRLQGLPDGTRLTSDRPKTGVWQWLRELQVPRPVLRLAYSLALVGAGAVGG